MRQFERGICGRLGLWVAILGVSLSAFAEKAPTAKELVDRAAKGRAELITVLGDVERFVPTMSTKEELYPYIAVLDKVEAIAIEKKYDLATLGSDPLKSLSSVLTRNAVKWVRLDKDEKDTLAVFFRRAENNSRSLVASQHGKYLNLVKEKKDLLLWHERVLWALDTVNALKSEPYVIVAYEELQGVIARRLVAIRADLDAPELMAVMKGTKSVPALQEVLAHLSQEVLKSKDPAFLKLATVWVVTLGANVRDLKGTAPHFVRTAPGQTLLEILSKLLTAGENPDVALAEPILAAMEPSQLTELGGMLQSTYEKNIPDGQLNFLYELTSRLLKRYKEMGLGAKQNDVEKIFQRIATIRSADKEDIEGSYRVRVARKYDGIVTIAHVGSGNFYVGLKYRREGVDLDWSLDHVAYNLEDKVWEAHHFAQGEPIFPASEFTAYHLEFTVETTGDGEKIFKGDFTHVFGTYSISGTRFETYMKVPEPAKSPLRSIKGIYRGFAAGQNMQLQMHHVGHRVQALYMPNKMVPISLNYGYHNPYRNFVYLTTAEAQSFKWLQVRGRLSDDGKVFRGEYIIGGFGRKYTFELTKVEPTPKE